MIAEANRTPITTVDSSFQLVRLRRATIGQARTNFGMIPSIVDFGIQLSVVRSLPLSEG
jgi:hypothetical protein